MPSTSPHPTAGTTPEHFAPPVFSPAEQTILRSQLAAASQELVQSVARERELERQLEDAADKAMIGREILWGVIAERDAQDQLARDKERGLRAQLDEAEKGRNCLVTAHTLTLASMQREIDSLHDAWLQASPASAPSPVEQVGSTMVEHDLHSEPGSISDKVHCGGAKAAQVVPRTLARSLCGLFKADEPVGEWDEGEALSKVETRG